MSTKEQRSTPADPETDAEMTVARNTNVNHLSLAILKTIEEGKGVKLVSIGANAVNQATKACGKSRGQLAQQGIDIAWLIYFTDRVMTHPAQVDGETITPGTQNTLSAIVHQAVILRR